MKLTGLLLLATACRHPAETRGAGYDAAVRIAHAWVECDQRDDDRCAAALMHIPPDYRGDALTRERASVLGGVRLIRERFGYIRALGPPVTDAKLVGVTWASGTAEYWDQHPRTAIATFPVTFSKLSKGYLRTEVCEIGATWQLKSIHYGLPLSNPSSAPMIKTIDRELAKVATSKAE